MLFKGTICRIEPSLEAAFIDFGQERYGFLPLTDIRDFDPKLHKVGYELVVSVVKPEKGQKGALLDATLDDVDGEEVRDWRSPNKRSSLPYISLALALLVLIIWVFQHV